MKRLVYWMKLRGPGYILLRLKCLLSRYRFSHAMAEIRIMEGLCALARHGAHPTFLTPGRVVANNGEFCRDLQRLGAEIAVHGYDHLDCRSLSRPAALRQLSRGKDAFRKNEIQVTGFRLPYLSQTEEFLRAVPRGMFEYSSNRAIWWDVVGKQSIDGATAIFESLRRFYRAEPAEAMVATPRRHDNLIEIPVSLPDDIQLHDGLNLGVDGMARAWVDMLRRIHERGELFVLMFHPELFERCTPALERTLQAAADLQPGVWVARLRDISRWWNEKAGFTARISDDAQGLRIQFDCSERASILVRNVDPGEATEPWDGAYRRLKGRTITLPTEALPFIGVSDDLPEETGSFLRDQGYILAAGEEADRCGLRLDSAIAARAGSEVGLIDFIETRDAPIARFWRWPDGAKSALAITGDLDALSLFDYTSRLLARQGREDRSMIVEVARPAAAAGLIVTDAPNLESWSHFVSDHPRGSIFHTPEMVQVFGKTLRNYPLALAAIDEDGGMLALLVAVRVQTLPGPLGAVSSRSILYAEPICRDDERGRSALAAVIAEHDARMRGKVLFTEVRALRAAGPEQEALLQCGYRREDYLNYVTDLTKPAQDLLDAMTKQMRRSIRTSQERGLRVEDATSTEGVEVLLGFLTGTYANAGVPLADRSLFEQTIRVLRPRGMVKLITAYHNDRPVGAELGLIYKDTVFAWYRGSERMNHLAPSGCMIWHDLEWGHSEGYKIYDQGGAGKPDVPYGVRDFKAKFGGQLVNYGRYYKVYSPWKLRLAEAAYNWKRNAGHRRSLGPASNTVQSSASRDPNAQTPPQETMR